MTMNFPKKRLPTVRMCFLVAAVVAGSLFLAGCSVIDDVNPFPRETTSSKPRRTAGSKKSSVSQCPPKTNPYKVNGQWYHPLKSASGYDKVGIASWYGWDFHGKKTACGEIYDMYAMTAAHKTLPLGTVVKVTNLENNRQATLRVNDRGPFVDGRIIDLSYAGAKALGTVDKGIAKVRIVVLSDGADRSSTSSSSTNTRSRALAKKFTVRVGAFANHDNAQRLLRELRSAGIGGAGMLKTTRKGQVLYIVTAGSYATRNEAERTLTRVKTKYPGSFIAQ